jgi:hypothetical protein
MEYEAAANSWLFNPGFDVLGYCSGYVMPGLADAYFTTLPHEQKIYIRTPRFTYLQHNQCLLKHQETLIPLCGLSGKQIPCVEHRFESLRTEFFNHMVVPL